MGHRAGGYFLKKHKGRLLFCALFFFLVGTVFVCWQEADTDTDAVTYGRMLQYMKEHKEEFLQTSEEPEVEETEDPEEEVSSGDTKVPLLSEDRNYLAADVFDEESVKVTAPDPKQEEIVEYHPLEGGTRENQMKIKKLYENASLDYLIQNFYIVNPTTTIDKKVFRVEEMLSKDCTIKKKEKPQILIFHTHGASEHFSESAGEKDDSVIGVGTRLKEILEKRYGYQVLHDETPYDLIDGKIDRSQAYTVAENALAHTLESYPSIEVMIDLHRDASSDGKTKRVTEINGKKVAQVMFFNGLSRNLSGNIPYLYNPNLKGNLAFSLQMKIKAMEHFEDFALPIFLKGYRYSLHLREKSLLIELGNEVNTVEEAKNAMEPLAFVLDAVLSGK